MGRCTGRCLAYSCHMDPPVAEAPAERSGLKERLVAGPTTEFGKRWRATLGRDPLLDGFMYIVIVVVILGFALSGLDTTYKFWMVPLQVAIIVIPVRGLFRSVRAERHRRDGILPGPERRKRFIGLDDAALVATAEDYYRRLGRTVQEQPGSEDGFTDLIVASATPGDKAVAEGRPQRGDEADPSTACRYVRVFGAQAAPTLPDLAALEQAAGDASANAMTVITTAELSKEFQRAAVKDRVFMIDRYSVGTNGLRSFMTVAPTNSGGPSLTRLLLRSIPMAFGTHSI